MKTALGTVLVETACIIACWVFTCQNGRDKLSAIIRRLMRGHYLPQDNPSYAELCKKSL